jgi:hypothetical protein
MLEFLLYFPMPIRLVIIFCVLFSVVPITGMMVFGNVRQAWEYTRDWLRVILLLFAFAAVLGLFLWPIMLLHP